MNRSIPLAEQMRPKKLEEVVGQEHLLGKEGFLKRSIDSSTPLSIILWGPPGCGKTTLAKLYADQFGMRFVSLSAVFSGISDLRKVVKEAKENTTQEPLFSKNTLLFVDEIHRFNKAQQDAFLPFLEDGTLILVGATTENPSFHLNNALLSRVRVLTLSPLNTSSLSALLDRYETTIKQLPLNQEARALLIEQAQGDGRYLFNLIENIQSTIKDETLDLKTLKQLLQKRASLSDKKGDQHYNLISALHKSIRGSDPDAALYWFCRMLEGGEDPLYLARRLIRMATEDVGLADPEALKLAVAARESYQMLGSPEGELALAEVVIYLSLAPKSNALYIAYKKAREQAANSGHLSPPKHILNAPTKLMEELGYGQGYTYDHNCKGAFSGQNYFPEGMERDSFYQPVERGFEREMKKRLEYFKKERQC